jgi:hypothetical protein
MIAPEREAAILRLYHAEKCPVGTIAAQLSLHHSTVRRVLGQAGVSIGREMSRPSIVDAFVPFIVETLAKYPRLRASRLYAMGTRARVQRQAGLLSPHRCAPSCSPCRGGLPAIAYPSGRASSGRLGTLRKTRHRQRRAPTFRMGSARARRVCSFCSGATPRLRRMPWTTSVTSGAFRGDSKPCSL